MKVLPTPIKNSKTLPLKIDTMDERLSLKMLTMMVQDFHSFKTGLAAHCRFKTTSTIDQWINRGNIPKKHLVSLWEFYDEFVSKLPSPFKDRKKKVI